MDLGIADLAYMFGVGSTAYAQHQTGEYKADIARMNSEIAGEQSDVAIKRGMQQEQYLRRDYSQLVGKQRAMLAAQGMDLNEDTALNIQLDTRRQEELDVLTLRNNTSMEAWGYKVQAFNYTENGKMVKRESDMGSFNTVLAGAADYAFSTGMLNAKQKPVLSRRSA